MKIIMTLILGIPNKNTQLWKMDNGIGDVWYCVRIRESHLEKPKAYFTHIEFTTREAAEDYLELKRGA